MTEPTKRSRDLTVVALDPPFKVGDGVLFGLQSKGEVDDPVPAVETTDFDTVIEIRTDGSGVDFFGAHVHGRRGDRFLYLSWGLPDQTEPFVMFARAKIKLVTIPTDLLDQCLEHNGQLVVEVEATNTKGQPSSGTIKPHDSAWRMR
jgi:hypothetical protein